MKYIHIGTIQTSPKSTSAPDIFVPIPKKTPRIRIIYSPKSKRKNDKKKNKNCSILDKMENIDRFKFPDITDRPQTRKPSFEEIIYALEKCSSKSSVFEYSVYGDSTLVSVRYMYLCVYIYVCICIYKYACMYV
jgi:hypothetical protein